MDRRWLFRVFGGLAALAPLAAKADEPPRRKTAHGLALHVSVRDPETMKLLLNNARNAHELYAERGESVTIEIVANSAGLHMLRDDTSPVKEEIRALRAKFSNIAFSACNNTKAAMERKEGKPVVLIPEAAGVPAGVVRLMELQEQGYAYERP
jgi:intracellular sulfur oxidation DsrE/DsrF family protein